MTGYLLGVGEWVNGSTILGEICAKGRGIFSSAAILEAKE
jgi:hypothetical protein